MGFSDKLAVSDGVAITLNCGLCGQPATPPHTCTKLYLRASRMVRVRCLAEPDSADPNDLFLIELEKGGEQYTTTRAVLERDYQEV